MSRMRCPNCMCKSFRLMSAMPEALSSVWECDRCGKVGQQEDLERRGPEGALVVGRNEVRDGKAKVRGGRR
jgi:ribosomal protein L37AE/L43A